MYILRMCTSHIAPLVDIQGLLKLLSHQKKTARYRDIKIIYYLFVLKHLLDMEASQRFDDMYI